MDYTAPEVLDIAVDFIGRWEGFRERPYLDSAGVKTVGYGFTKHVPFWDEIRESIPLSEKEGDRFLRRALTEVYIPEVEQLSNGILSAPHKVAALSSFTYNVGVEAAESSTLIDDLLAGREDEAEEELLKWVYADGKVLEGLVARREAEKRLMERDERNAPEDMGVEDNETPPVFAKRLPETAPVEIVEEFTLHRINFGDEG